MSHGSPRGRERSFAQRVARAAFLTTLTAMAVAFGLFIARQWQVERDSMVARRTTLAQVMASNASSALMFRDGDKLREVLRSASTIPDLRGVAAFDLQGRPAAGSGEWGKVRPSGTSAATSAFDARTLVVHMPIRADQARIGELVLVSSLDGLHRTFLGYGLFAVLIFASVLAAAVSTSLWLARRVIQPVEQLSRAVEDVRRTGDFSLRVARGSDRELAQLTESFNGLLSELEVTVHDLVVAREQAESANRLKSEFLATISHEMRTPLNGVLGLAQVMTHDTLSEPQRERLQLLQSSASGLMAIISDLLDVAEAEAGRLKLAVAAFGMRELVDTVTEPFRILARDKGLTLDVEVAPDAAGQWTGDEARVGQILSNLLSNAVKFTTSGGVRVRVDSGAFPDELVTISVADTGCGIPAAKAPLLFDKFTQLDGSSTRQFGGTGLGLSICRELAMLMSGSIEVESTEGVGSRFTATLALQRCEVAGTPAAARPDPEDAPAPRALRVLAAEDNPTNALVLKTLLELAGVDLQLVGDGQAAVEAWEASRVDLVLMDIQMPVMDGLTAIKRIRSLEAERQLACTPILACTANVMAHEQHAYHLAGVQGVVAKPLEANVLFAAINSALQPASSEDSAAAAEDASAPGLAAARP